MILSKEVFSNNREVHPRLHAKDVDRLLGYKITKIEEKLVQKYRAYDISNDESSRKKHFSGAQTWIGLHPQILQTPYCDIFKALSMFKGQQIKRVVDIGAGYGRVGLVTKTLFPNAEFLGFEIVEKRQVEGERIIRKFNLENCSINCINVLDKDFILPEADIYFIYDFSTEEDISHILKILSLRIKEYPFSLVVTGDRINNLLKKTYSHVWKNQFQVHNSHLKVYPIRING